MYKCSIPSSKYLYRENICIVTVHRSGVNNIHVILPSLHLAFDIVSLNILSRMLTCQDILALDIQGYPR